MLHNSRNISDRRIAAQPGFYQPVPTKRGKREPVQIIRARGLNLLHGFVFLGSIKCNLVMTCADDTSDQRPSCV